MAAWGFDYRTAFTWVKSNRYGAGNYVRQQAEWLLIARRGDMPLPLPAARVGSVISAPAGEHSQKPEIFYELIERMYPGFAKLELFARQQRLGWTAWGAEVPLEVPA